MHQLSLGQAGARSLGFHLGLLCVAGTQAPWPHYRFPHVGAQWQEAGVGFEPRHSKMRCTLQTLSEPLCQAPIPGSKHSEMLIDSSNSQI